MADKSTVLTVKILTDASQAAKGAEEAASGYQKFQGSVDNMVPAAAIALGAIATLGATTVDSAKRSEQAMGGLDAVFGDHAETVKKWAGQAAESVGLAESEYAELATTAGAQLQNLGLSSEDALTGTHDLIEMGADLAATFGGTTTDAVNALTSALRGESDPAERYGLSLNQAAVNAKLAEDGLTGLEGEAASTAKAQAILALATEQAAGANGQFAREADTASGAQQIANAEFENAAAALGESLLPMVTQVTESLSSFAKWVSQNSSLVMVLVGVIGAIAAIIITLSVALKIAAIAQWAMNAALFASPITWVVIAIIALIAAIVVTIMYADQIGAAFAAAWQWVVDAATAAWEWIVDIVTAAWEWIVSIATAVGAWFIDMWNQWFVLPAQIAWDLITSMIEGAWNWILSLAENALRAYILVWNTIVNAASAAWSWITSIVQGAWEGILAGANAVGSFVRGIWDGILGAARTVFKTLQDVVTNVFDAIMVPINALADAFNWVVDSVKMVIDWIGKIKLPDAIAGLFGLAASGAGIQGAAFAGVTASPVLGASRYGATLAAAGGGAGTTIVVQGGLDSADTIARRIKGILESRERRTGGVTIARRTR